ncbi:MAG TPA: hypothetical protein VHX38_10870 [Pseudonocardiaceae bacterium]|jgi:hypothetical protein|nr:hypothetical protein [Pseudonocardiaceae bacterium]
MRLAELDQLLIECLTSEDHPEIVGASRAPGVETKPADHTRVNVSFASGATCHVLVRRVEGPKVPRHADYDLPQEVI